MFVVYRQLLQSKFVRCTKTEQIQNYDIYLCQSEGVNYRECQLSQGWFLSAIYSDIQFKYNYPKRNYGINLCTVIYCTLTAVHESTHFKLATFFVVD